MRHVLVWSACLLGCSSLLDYDDVGFDPKDASLDASPDAMGGTAGATPEAGADATAGTGNVAHPDAEGEAPSNPCDGVTCSGFGDCEVVDGSEPACSCEPGYHPSGLACEKDESCTGVACGRCGTCEVIAGKATCTCPDGFSNDGTGCVVDPNPCDTTDCGADAACVPEAHCQPLGACVPRCDCSNCGNCGSDNSDGRWDDWQEYCGAEPNQSPATVACNKPCPPGDGCLPFADPICWPMEGCFSL
jgi:hypothetical protein